MASICAYFTFNGNCRQAMMFYQKCFGGNLSLQSIGDSPKADGLPKGIRQCVLHATLSHHGLVIMASDIVGDNGLLMGNAVSLMVSCGSEKELRLFYQRLAEGGKATHPIAYSYWGALFGGLTDKYGNSWFLHFAKQVKN